jgi:hypothetical protein
MLSYLLVSFAAGVRRAKLRTTRQTPHQVTSKKSLESIFSEAAHVSKFFGKILMTSTCVITSFKSRFTSRVVKWSLRA